MPPPSAVQHYLPVRSQLTSSGPRELRFVGWAPARAPILLVPIWLVLSSLTWFSPGRTDAARALVSLACLGAGLGLLAWSRPRRTQLRLRPAQRQLELPGGHVETLSESARWLLVADHPADAPRPRYAALLLDRARRWPLLVGEDPAQLLRQLRLALSHWPGEVENEWALPSGVQPWSFRTTPPGSVAEPSEERAVLRGFGASRGLRWVLWIAMGLVLLDLVLLVLSASAHLAAVHPLSVVLAVLSGIWLVLITVAVATQGPRLVVGSQLVLEQRCFGLRQASWHVSSNSVRGVYLLAAIGGIQHLLVDSTEGPLALPLRARHAESAKQQLLRSLARFEPAVSASESIASAPRRWQNG